jgi:hypothetical protein
LLCQDIFTASIAAIEREKITDLKPVKSIVEAKPASKSGRMHGKG